jgi:NADPH:quinone reductase-like Zn-dependent oxidoreductase
MRAWQISGNFGIENLASVNVESARLGPEDVRVSLKACAINYRDLMVIKGIYNPKQVLPLVPLSDGAGVVVETGTEVKDFKCGDRVIACFSQMWPSGRVEARAQAHTLGGPLPGTLQESRVFHHSGLVHCPLHLDYVEAATLPCAALTAFNALFHEGDLHPGDSVLIEGTGGVSIFALQFAQLASLNTIVISSSDEKLERTQKLGASHCINYSKNPDWEERVKDITLGQGVDLVVEVGGAKTLSKAIASVKRGGTICVIGALSSAVEALDIRPILMRQLRLQGLFVGSQALFLAMNRVVGQAKLKPVIDKVFDFQEAKAAFSYFAQASHFGKVCIRIP